MLIVEADRRIADSLVLRLTARGYGVASAVSLAEAEQALGGRWPDLVILGLGVTAGDRLIRQIRQARAGATVPVILLGTGAEAVGTSAQAVAAGADDFFRQPGELDLLVEKVTTLLGPGRPVRDGAEDTVDFSSLNALVWTEPPRRVPPVAASPSDAFQPAPDSADFSSLNRLLRASTPPAGALSELEDVGPDWTPDEPARASEPVAPAPSQPAALVAPPTSHPPAAPSRPPVMPERLPTLPPAASRPPPAASRPPERPSLPPLPRRPLAGLSSRPPAPQPPVDDDAPPADRPGRGFTAAEAPVPPDEATWQARLQPGRSIPLGERPLGTILAAAWRLAFTGRVEVAAGGALRRVFLDAGQPTYVDSSDPDEDLAATLVAEGGVTRAMAARARARARQTGASADEVLIEQGFVTADAAWRALRAHVIERIVALFGLETGEALAVAGGPRPPDPVDLGLGAGRLILDGIRRRYGRLRLYQAYGTPALVPRLERHPGETLRLRSDEEAVLRACDGRRTAAEIARGLRLGEVDVLAVLYGLSTLGILEAPLAVGTGALPALPGDLLARAGAPRTPDDLPGYADLVARKLADVQTADYYTILEVPRGATGAEVEAAFDGLRRRFDPQRMRADGPLFGAVQEIAAVLEDAHAMLGDATRRGRYEAALGDER